MVELLDTSVLIALLDQNHDDHAVVSAWLLQKNDRVFATCPITENGAIRILSGATYPNPLGDIPTIFKLMGGFCDRNSHQFWHDDVSLLSDGLVIRELIVGPKQLTDVYLLALAVSRGGRFVTFDRRVNADAVRGGQQALKILS